MRPRLRVATSGRLGHVFHATLDGQEPFLVDHVIGGRRLMPGVASLELVRVALEEACVFATSGRLVLEQIIWMNPLVVNQGPFTLAIAIRPGLRGAVRFEVIHTAQPIVYCRGKAALHADTGERAVRAEVALAQRSAPSHRISGAECYAVFDESGAHYGRTHRGVRNITVYESAEHARVSVAEIEWPFEADDYAPDYVFHPGRLDSAMQSTVALLALDAAGRAMPGPPALPFAVDQLELFERCPAQARAHVIEVEARRLVSRKVDLEITDQNGTVCVRMRGLSVLAPRIPVQEKAS